MKPPSDLDALLAAPSSPENGAALMAWFSDLKGRVARGDMTIGILPVKELDAVPAALRKAADSGIGAARLELATWLADPPNGEPDILAADAVLSAAVRDAVPDAALQLVRLRWFARRDDASNAERYEAFLLAQAVAGANPQNDQALYLLGLLTGQGFGTDAAPSAAFELQQKAAALGNADALFELYVHHQTGLGTNVDAEAAFAAVRRAAEAGHPRATYNLGAFYATGQHVARDAAKAIEWYTRSHDAGNPRATATLAVMHARGEGTRKDLERAQELFDDAESLGLDVDELRKAVGL